MSVAEGRVVSALAQSAVAPARYRQHCLHIKSTPSPASTMCTRGIAGDNVLVLGLGLKGSWSPETSTSEVRFFGMVAKLGTTDRHCATGITSSDNGTCWSWVSTSNPRTQMVEAIDTPLITFIVSDGSNNHETQNICRCYGRQRLWTVPSVRRLAEQGVSSSTS